MLYTEADYKIDKQWHDCTIRYKGYCQACDDMREYEEDFIKDKHILINEEVK